jgi:hypothetical protein
VPGNLLDVFVPLRRGGHGGRAEGSG